jgi:uncharacterized membrane protein (DUF2068 family)
MPRHPHDPVIRLIALLKLAKAVLLIAVGVGALSIHHGEPRNWISDWVHAIAVDPHGKYVNRLLAKIGSLDAHQLREIGIGSLLYAAVFLVEGVGLMLRKVWAELLTVIVTTSFIPLEIYELVEHKSWAKVVVIMVNALVVAYLLRRLRREHHWPFH